MKVVLALAMLSGASAFLRGSVATAPVGTYTGTAKVGFLSVNEQVVGHDDSTMDLTLSGAISFSCEGEAYTMDASGAITVTDIDTSGDCLHDQLAANALTFKSASYDASADTIEIVVTALGVTVDTTLAKESLATLSFGEFKAKFGKVYASVEDEAARARVFAANVEAMLERRLALPVEQRATVGVTKFFDQSAEEFKRSHLNYRPVAPSRADAPPTRNYTDAQRARARAASTVDWASAGATTAVKDQGYCGSCWAFSAVEQVESAWFLAGNDLTEFSTEQVVQCDTTDAGCNGGDSPTAYAYIKSAGGLASNAAYPYSHATYEGTTGSCDSSFTTVGGDVQGYEYVSKACTSYSCGSSAVDEDGLQTGIASAPASICVNAENWNSYTGGVWTSSTCGKNGYYALDHCVQLIGYNTAASTPYWIVRNSWGSDWGEDGMIYLTMGENTCGVADEAMTVTF